MFCFLSLLILSISLSLSPLSSGGDDDASYRCEVVVATALGRLAEQPDRPMACRLLPSAILPLPEHKEAADRATAETHDRPLGRRSTPALPLTLTPSTPTGPIAATASATTITLAAVDRRAFCGFAPSVS